MPRRDPVSAAPSPAEASNTPKRFIFILLPEGNLRLQRLTAPLIDPKTSQGKTPVWPKSFHGFLFKGRTCLLARFSRYAATPANYGARPPTWLLEASFVEAATLGKLLEAFCGIDQHRIDQNRDGGKP
jgi:hypothetical protein